jgi:hypothetical protein
MCSRVNTRIWVKGMEWLFHLLGTMGLLTRHVYILFLNNPSVERHNIEERLVYEQALFRSFGFGTVPWKRFHAAVDSLQITSGDS